MVIVNDTAGNNSFDDRSFSIERSVNILIHQVNTPPIINLHSQYFNLNLNEISLVQGIFIEDHDIGLDTGVFEVKLFTVHGKIILDKVDGMTFSKGDGYFNDEVIILGKLKSINDALKHLRYQCQVASGCTADMVDIISIIVNDNGNYGKGGEKI